MRRIGFTLIAFLVLALISGCGDDGEPPSGSSVAAPGNGTEASAFSEPVGNTTTTSVLVDVSWAPPNSEVVSTFDVLVREYPDVVAFRPTELPEGAVLADYWWPVALAETSSAGSEDVNPRVVDGEPPEVRLVLRVGDAWLEIIEGVQGDLGNLPGRDAGMVAGNSASAHDALGAVIVQWSRDGLWYAVVGRGLAEETVQRIANQMQTVR